MEILNNIQNLNLHLKVNSIEQSKVIDPSTIKVQNITPSDTQLNTSLNNNLNKNNLSKEALKNIEKEINSLTEKLDIGISFVQDNQTGKNIIQFIDASTNKVVKQIPTEEVLKVMEGINKFLEKNAKQFPIGKILNEVA